MSAETVPVQEELEEILDAEKPMEETDQPPDDIVEEQSSKEERVPLSALQKERRKRQEVEQKLRWLEEQNKKNDAPPEQDESRYEPATKEDLGNSQQKIIRSIEERRWTKENPEKAEFVNDKLSEFLKQRPNLTLAIENSENRYEEAWELMDKLTPKQRAALKISSPKKDAPGNPGSIPKAAAMNQSIDVMTMTDSEFSAWRKSQRKGR